MRCLLLTLTVLTLSSGCTTATGDIVSPTPSAVALNATWLATPPPNLNPSLFPSPIYRPPTPGITVTPTPYFAPPTATPTPFVTPAGPLPTLGPSSYVSKELVVAAVGSGPGEVGIDERGMPPSGPESFDVDESGNVYILDSINRRVNKYGPDGNSVSWFAYAQNDEMVDVVGISAWKDGSVFLADNTRRQVTKYNSLGQVVSQYPILLSMQVEGVRVSNSEGQRAVRLFISTEGRIMGAHLLDTDLAGNSYVYGAEEPADQTATNPRPVRLWVLKYNGLDQLVDRVVLPAIQWYTSTRRNVVIQGSGDIFYMLPLKDIVRILKWSERR